MWWCLALARLGRLAIRCCLAIRRRRAVLPVISIVCAHRGELRRARIGTVCAVKRCQRLARKDETKKPRSEPVPYGPPPVTAATTSYSVHAAPSFRKTSARFGSRCSASNSSTRRATSSSWGIRTRPGRAKAASLHPLSLAANSHCSCSAARSAKCMRKPKRKPNLGSRYTASRTNGSALARRPCRMSILAICPTA